MNRVGPDASKPVVRQAIRCLLGVLASGLPLAAAWSAPPGNSPEQTACVERAVDAVQNRYRAIRDLRARFSQTTRSVALGSGSGGGTQRSTGTVHFAKPGKMRWSYEQPEPSLVVSDGETLWIYDPERREAQRLAMGAGALSGAAIQFLLGRGEILREFRVKAESCGESSVELTLLPREPASYEKLGIRTDPATGEILQTRIVDLLGNVTEVRFEEIRTDLDPPDGLFRFEAPAGVRVIELDGISRGRRERE